MGYKTDLKVSKNNSATFEDIPTSNITNSSGSVLGGVSETIFEVDNGDIYTMAEGVKLQILEKNVTNFKDVTNSNINDGQEGMILQASNDDIYVTGYEVGLKILKSGNWIKNLNQFEDVTNAKITNGNNVIMMQTANDDIYVTRKGSKLMVLRNNSNLVFTKTNESTKDKGDGTITIKNFEDTYSILQYKKVGATSVWEDVLETSIIDNLSINDYQFQ